MDLLILPNQLFDIKYIKKVTDYKSVIIWEHPHYFTTYNYNKKKLLLHRASMKYYYDYLKKKQSKRVEYVDFYSVPKITDNEYVMFDPVDRIRLPAHPHTIMETPNFLLSKLQYQEYRKKTSKFFFNAFYMWSKKTLDIIPNVKSKDKENRKALPKGINIPGPPTNTSTRGEKKYIQDATKYIEAHFDNNVGTLDDVENEFMFPITHKTASRWLRYFIREKLKEFGKYQDAISSTNNILFHSLLASSINIGLIQPQEIIDKLLKEKRLRVPMNSLEGYIRQLFWREYQRYCYIYYDFKNKNYFGNSRKLGREWYEGTTKIVPVDDCIRRAFATGYLHHIERLMVVGNWMVLSGICPREGYRWFMEFSCDSYEWVMHQNVLEMVFFISGGDTMRRPYMSSSNYIIKMSDYRANQEWTKGWDKQYHEFIKKNKDKLWKYRYFFGGLK